MIIALRGLPASGKSHLVREIMRLYPKKEEVRSSGRRHPVGYKFFGLQAPLFIPGHYDATQSSGTDSLWDIDETYRMIWDAYDAGFSVLYEGKNVGDGISRIANMFAPDHLEIVIIEHPISECVMTVRDLGRKIKVETVQKLDRNQKKDVEKFRAIGYTVHLGDRTESMTTIRTILEI